jgi:ABC-2 type transport system permease protein
MRRPRPLKAARLLALSAKLGILNALQYRADFAIALVQTAVSMLTALGAVSVVFGQTDDLGGWRQEELIALIGVFFIVRGLVDVVIRPSMERLMQGVRQGTLDFDLTKPADAQVLVSVRQVDIWRMVDVTVGLLILIFAIVRLGEQIGLDRALGFVVLLFAGLAIIYSFLLILSTLAFWLVRLENILVLFATMYEAGKWPIGLYPPWLRIGLTALVPIAFAITIPVESLVGRLEPVTLALALGVAVAFLLGSRWFWRFGLRHYTGASA